MPDPKEPRKETVRITLPPRVSPNPFDTTAGPRDTVRINLPTRPPADGVVPTRLPPSPSPAAAPVASINVAPKAAPIVRVDEIPMPLCWALLGASAVILIIQIWNYLS
jgi:hypothetical protein